MRTFITLGVKRSDGAAEVLVHPDKDREAHVEAFKKFQRTGTSGAFSEVQLWGSDIGIQKRIRLADIKAEAPKTKTDQPNTKPEKAK
jgi:hypothetical protein